LGVNRLKRWPTSDTVSDAGITQWNHTVTQPVTISAGVTR
jgi:hypothetical protein